MIANSRTNARRITSTPPNPAAAILDGTNEHALPDKVNGSIAKTTVEILTLRPTMSYGLSPARQ